jgi:beta-1,4-N-acetylglucosaminyltransferase
MPLSEEHHKLCFVTIGATAPFDSLLANVFQESFFTALGQNGYTDLLVQHGKEGRAIYEQFIQNHPPADPIRSGINVKGFDFNKMGLSQEMGFTKENEDNGYEEGLILSHAGKPRKSFWILLDALFGFTTTGKLIFIRPI